MDTQSIINSNSSPNKRISELVIASLLIPLIIYSAWLALYLYINLYAREDWPFSDLSILLNAFVLSISLFLFSSPVFVIISLSRINNSRGQLKGSVFAYLGLVMCIPGMIVFLYYGIVIYSGLFFMWVDILTSKLLGT